MCIVVDNVGGLSYRTCTGVGPNYIRTFDGLEYLFPGRCHYTVYSDSLRSISVKYINCHSYQLCRKVRSHSSLLPRGSGPPFPRSPFPVSPLPGSAFTKVFRVTVKCSTLILTLNPNLNHNHNSSIIYLGQSGNIVTMRVCCLRSL